MESSVAPRPRIASKTRERLINAAQHLLHEDGLSSVTTQKIARACGLSEGTIYRHFSSFDDLILTAIRLSFAGEFQPHIDALVASAGHGRIEDNLRKFVVDISPIYSIVAPTLGMLAASPVLAARHAEALRADGIGPTLTLDHIAEYFLEEQRLGRVCADVDARVAASILTSVCFHRSLVRSVFDEDPWHSNDDELAAALSMIVRRGIEPQSAQPNPHQRGEQ